MLEYWDAGMLGCWDAGIRMVDGSWLTVGACVVTRLKNGIRGFETG